MTPTCFTCVNARSEPTVCGAYSEPVDSEIFAAQNCEAYEEVPCPRSSVSS